MSRIFISYANVDGGDAAHQLAAALEATHRRCWIAPRDVLPGVPYPGQIVRAIEESCGLVLLLTPGANQSSAVLSELELAYNERKIIAALTVRGTEPSRDLKYFLSVRHRIPWTEARVVAPALGAVLAPLGGAGAAEEPSSVTRGHRFGETFRDWPEGPELVLIPPGSFMMGSPEGEEGRSDDEDPVHPVTIGYPLAVGKYPVTRGQWRTFAHANGHKSDRWLQSGFPQNDSHPVVNITWQDAVDYAAWLSQKTGHAYRLLSEAEAEYITRAGSQTSYFWGDMHLYTQKRVSFNELQGTWPVGRFKANAFGLYDTAGLVWCWTEDRWHADYHGAPADGSAWDEGADVRRVVRGGSWNSDPRCLRSARRSWLGSVDSCNFLGLRVASG